MQSVYFKGLFFALASGVIWGFSGVCGEYLFTQKNFDPFFLTCIRLFLSGLILFCIVFMRQKRKIFAIFNDKKAKFDLLIYSIFGLALCQLTYYLTISYANAAVATTLQYTAPAMIMLWVCFKERSKPSFREFLALICASFGIFLFATHGDFGNFIISKKALIIGLLSAFCVVIYSISPISINKKYGTNSVLAIGLLLSGGFFCLIYPFFNSQNHIIIDISTIIAICGIVFLGTICGFSFYLYGVNFIGPKRASLIASIEPLMAAFFGYIWLGTKFVFYDFLGFFLIILCTILLSKK